MAAEGIVKMIEATFAYFTSIGNFRQDPIGVNAVRQVRDRMVSDLGAFTAKPTPIELAELCREWRAQRIDTEGPPSYPPDLFIESVCEAIELL
jgi:hypothetical protein